MMKFCCAILLFFVCPNLLQGQQNVVWNSQSRHSGESMPVGALDVGLNVWAEKNDVFVYMARGGSFDENNTLLKSGRLRITLSPNPFDGGEFRQELHAERGYILLRGRKGKLDVSLKIWADAAEPQFYAELNASHKVTVRAAYESWRFRDQETRGRENNQNSYKWAPQAPVFTFADSTGFYNNGVEFYHQNRAETVFDVAVRQQGLDSLKKQIYNPLAWRISGGRMQGTNMIPDGTHTGTYMNTPFKSWALHSRKPLRSVLLAIVLPEPAQGARSAWLQAMRQQTKAALANAGESALRSAAWWRSYWDRSFIRVQGGDTLAQQAAKNYTLFRFMLGSTARGTWPVKFNGGLFTTDPVTSDPAQRFTPDFRNWGGGTHTAQNQRLVYWPLLKSGDTDLMQAQFEFYRRLLPAAELRSQVYWGHAGASFTEQLENFGLPNPAEYGWKRPPGYDKGMEHNAWLEYQWDTALEFCKMILDQHRYTAADIDRYLPLVRSCLVFFKEHYVYLAKQRGSKIYDSNGQLVLYPGSAAETYKMAYNPISTVAALRVVATSLAHLNLLGPEERAQWVDFLNILPPLSFREISGHTVLAPAVTWARINNTESPQLYPVFPWGLFGVGKPGLDTAISTYRLDPDVQRFRSHVGWKQDAIFAARLGLTDEAARLTFLKLKDSGRRFPAFWGPGFDWVPDHNWGGSGMIALQEMLLQCEDDKLRLFPAWPADQDVHFKLHAPGKTVVEAKLEKGKMTMLKVFPESRRKDVINMLAQQTK
ncbi:DUF5703 domain-containing protein [Pedobacter sp. SYP-B3415]|uniref:DUF5703 domain-containing protein n=1 Tax=Pedobacter sp. SYP-B3415 TaxID=2496641 RepID=UPI00101D707F|nr:DUF5703 domain-containing protein [Pedobacter sp. SYP-B3415]